MATPINLTGRRFGRLIVLQRLPNDSRGEARWGCICDCGKKTAVLGSHLRRGRVKSCGCFAADMLIDRNRKNPTYGNLRHGGRNTRLYSIWTNMKTRCLNPRNRNFKWYGAAGVSICPEWMRFEEFQAWALSSGYHDDLTIDRIDPFGSYSPSNCRWIPLSQQRANQRRSVKCSS